MKKDGNESGIKIRTASRKLMTMEEFKEFNQSEAGAIKVPVTGSTEKPRKIEVVTVSYRQPDDELPF